MKKSTLFISSSAVALVAPVIALAQQPNFFYVQSWFSNIKYFASQAVNIAMIALTLWFIVSVIRYVAVKEPKDIPDRRKTMINSLIGLFVAVSVWGIIRLAGGVLGTTNITDQIVCPPGTVNFNGKCI
jgi:cellobiose-specific phosphotransferase system component IIC